MNNDEFIVMINEGIIKIMKSARDESLCLVEQEKKKLDAFKMTEENIKSVNKINDFLKSIGDNIQELENKEINIIDINKEKEITLDDDFKNKKVQYIEVEGNKFYVDTQKDCLIKLCEYLTRDIERREVFLNSIDKLGKLFSENKYELSSPKYISSINMYVETQRNSNALARIMQRILIGVGLSKDIVKIGVK